MKLFDRGVARKQIPRLIGWIPQLTYEAIKKIIQKGSRDRRAAPRPGPDRRKHWRL